ncbi:MAG: ArgR family transcriptional regulator [Bacteroidales bacterium]|jgi:transcriptional regulator of arginine metabolism|nr:ArgR family transcriptional regulator [Bacteroidales bacterium]
MSKTSRLALIERLVRENVIGSQEDLLRMVEDTGMKCTQATLSRDLRQLGISRGFDGSGGYRYLLPGGREGEAEALPGSATAAITGMTWARGLLLISTPPGFASAVAIRIDRAGRYEIAGTVAGDDTILLIPRDNISNEAIEECLKTIFKSDIK